jgi:hypothetical protein
VGLLGASGPDAFRRFQSTATYCITCSDNSSEGDYDPTYECFVVIIGEGEGEVGGAGNAAVCDNVAVTPLVGVTPPPYDATCAAQIAQLSELEAKLNAEREQLRQLKATLQRDKAGPSTQGASVAGRVARERINANADVDEMPNLARANQKFVAAGTLISSMPEPSTPEGRNLRREAQALIKQAAMQQAESFASRIRHQSATRAGGGDETRGHRSTLCTRRQPSTKATRGPLPRIRFVIRTVRLMTATLATS